MPRLSIHVEPHDAVAIARHYIGDLVYGANDGIITTFAVVAGVAGGALSHTAVLIVGGANLAADGLSMAVGNFLAIRSHESARAADNLPEEEARPFRHAVATFVAFVVAGSVPLVPYVLPAVPRAGIRLVDHVDVGVAVRGRRRPDDRDRRSLVDRGTRNVVARCDRGCCRIRRGRGDCCGRVVATA